MDKFESKYETCNGYCQSIGATCTGAWEEVSDSCKVDRGMKCDETLDTSDAICECNGECMCMYILATHDRLICLFGGRVFEVQRCL